MPPSTLSSAPATKLASSEAKKIAAAAISSGGPSMQSWPPRCGEGVAEHGQPTLGLLGGGLVLDDIPVFSDYTALDPYDVCHYPVGGLPDIAESTVQHHIITVGSDQRVLVAHVGRCGFHKFEEAFTPRFDVRAVLNVIRRPESLRGCVISPVEQCVERLQH